MPKRFMALLCALLLSMPATAAYAEVVVVVSSESPVDSLSRAELTDIFLGRTVRLPSGNAAIPIDQAESSPAHQAFYNRYLDRTPAQIKAHWSRLIFTGRGHPPRTADDSSAMARAIADNPNAIGYLDEALIDERLRKVSIE